MNPTYILEAAQFGATRTWQNLWTWQGRATRFEYLTFRLGVLLVLYVFERIASFVAPTSSTTIMLMDMVSLFLILSLIYTQVLVSIRRMHDIGFSGKIYLGYLAVLVASVVTLMVTSYMAYINATSYEELNTILARLDTAQFAVMVLEIMVTAAFALIPGTKGPNRYGAQPCGSACAYTPPAVAVKPATVVAAKPVAKAQAKPVVKAKAKAKPKTKPKAKPSTSKKISGKKPAARKAKKPTKK